MNRKFFLNNIYLKTTIPMCFNNLNIKQKNNLLVFWLVFVWIQEILYPKILELIKIPQFLMMLEDFKH